MDAKRKTIQRQLIHAAVKDLNCHANAEQVYDYVIMKYPSISKGTVYRNLNQMANDGDLLRFTNVNGTYRYDHNCHSHYHFICEQCGCVFDVEDYFSDICSRVKNENEFDIKGHTITFNGICSECKNNG